MFFNRGAFNNEPDLTAVIMNQLSLKSGLKNWGEKGGGSVHSYIKQIHIRDTFIPIHRKEFTKEQRNTILESHLFLKENRDRILKVRKVADGNNQRDSISKKEAI